MVITAVGISQARPCSASGRRAVQSGRIAANARLKKPTYTDYYINDVVPTKHTTIPFPGNAPTELQVERLLAWERAGAVAFVAYSVDAVREVVEKLKRGEIK